MCLCIFQFNIFFLFLQKKKKKKKGASSVWTQTQCTNLILRRRTPIRSAFSQLLKILNALSHFHRLDSLSSTGTFLPGDPIENLLPTTFPSFVSVAELKHAVLPLRPTPHLLHRLHHGLHAQTLAHRRARPALSAAERPGARQRRHRHAKLSRREIVAAIRNDAERESFGHVGHILRGELGLEGCLRVEVVEARGIEVRNQRETRQCNRGGCKVADS